MSDVAIRCDGLSKQYRIGKRERYRALRDVLTDSLSAPFRALRRNGLRSPVPGLSSGPPSSVPGPSSGLPSPVPGPSNDTFWALDNVSFEVRHGEVVGIIGRNGAGKSTLLKILSRITEPTRGYAEINGRVGSLLEVGTGFHPELTGRENIYLNGAILGMKKAEIERRFDEIVAFAETEKFLDTPVKYYSSGMQMRLAFAVAAHLDPEILLVDEVLAVGDAQFQKKCLGKMGEVAREGRTVLFVSHNMAAVRSLCTCAFLLEQGHKVFAGDVEEAIQSYLGSDLSSGATLDNTRRTHSCSDVAITSGRLLRSGIESNDFLFGDSLTIELELTVHRSIKLSVEVLLRDQQGTPLAFNPSGLSQGIDYSLSRGRHTVRCDVESLPLAEGRYSLDVMLAETGIRFFDYIESAFSFTLAATAIGPRHWNFVQRRGQGSFVLPVRYSLESPQSKLPD